MKRKHGGEQQARHTNRNATTSSGVKRTVTARRVIGIHRVQDVIREFLGELGCRMSLARNGREAIELYVEADGAFDLVLMDCRMPRMDGFDATRAIRDWERNGARRQVPVIALTAGALATERERCALVGMNGFLAKPVTLGELYDALVPHASDSAGRSATAIA